MARGLRGWLAPDVDSRGASFLGRTIAGRPGPVWSMIAWDLVMFVLMSLNLAALTVKAEELVGRSVPVVYFAASLVILSLLGARTPSWLIHLLVDLNIVMLCWIAWTAPSDTRTVAMLIFLVIPAVYVATWLPRPQMIGHLVVIAAAAAAAVLARGYTSDTSRGYIATMGVCIGLAFFVSALVRHLNQQATVDPLTGLLNRAGLATAADWYERTGEVHFPRSVIVVDLDDFKAVNDEQGHDAGDEMLREVGAVMRAQLRPNDTITRTGGDEFVLLLMGTGVDQAREVAQRLAAALPIACSFGIAHWSEDMPVDEAVAAADATMYAQKNLKKGRLTRAQ